MKLIERSRLIGLWVPLLLVAALVGSGALDTWRSIQSPTSNREYSPGDFRGPLEVIRKESNPIEGDSPKIIARKLYFPYMAGASILSLPYTDYEGLVRYACLNQVDYLFLEYQHLRGHPFAENFEKRETPYFQLLYADESARGTPIELYRFIGPAGSQQVSRGDCEMAPLAVQE